MDAPSIATTKRTWNRAGGCSICTSSTRAAFIDPLLQAGFTASRIEREAKTAGIPVKGETVAKHARHLMQMPPGFDHIDPADLEATLPETQNGDLAELVAKTAHRNLATGQARVSIADGLKATAILDKRAEKAENRRFLMNLAQLLSGGGQPPPKQLIEGDAIEGDYVEVDEDNPLLAPPELRE